MNTRHYYCPTCGERNAPPDKDSHLYNRFPVGKECFYCCLDAYEQWKEDTQALPDWVYMYDH